jgi:hypothetical protein
LQKFVLFVGARQVHAARLGQASGTGGSSRISYRSTDCGVSGPRKSRGIEHARGLVGAGFLGRHHQQQQVGPLLLGVADLELAVFVFEREGAGRRGEPRAQPVAEARVER